MTLADEKEALATIFFECARYERPSTEWIAALDLFATKVAETERETCAKIAEGAQQLPNDGKDFSNGWCSASVQIAQALRMRSNAEVSDLSTRPHC
jgi:hypothetical protein